MVALGFRFKGEVTRLRKIPQNGSRKKEALDFRFKEEVTGLRKIPQNISRKKGSHSILNSRKR